MTPEERAERIVVDLSGQTFSAEGEGNAWLSQKIVAAIREATNSAILNEILIQRAAIFSAMKVAYEDAAEIADKEADAYRDATPESSGKTYMAVEIGDKIRARSKRLMDSE